MDAGMLTQQTGLTIGLVASLVMVVAWAVSRAHVAAQALELARKAEADAAAARAAADTARVMLERAIALEAMVAKVAEAAQKIVERVVALEALVKVFGREQGGG